MISLIFQGRVRNLVDEGAAVVMGIHYDAGIEEKNQENDQEPYGFPCIRLLLHMMHPSLYTVSERSSIIRKSGIWLLLYMFSIKYKWLSFKKKLRKI